MTSATDHIRTYHQARVFSTTDIDEQIHTLNQITHARGIKGNWVCARVISNPRDGDMAIFVHLEDYSNLVSEARENQRAYLRRHPRTAEA